MQIYFAKKAEEAKKHIDKDLLDENGNVDLGKFDKNVMNSGKKMAKGGWTIEKDYSQHGGSKWKLKNEKGERFASLDENGKVLRN